MTDRDRLRRGGHKPGPGDRDRASAPAL